jgi:hypothetical protein
LASFLLYALSPFLPNPDILDSPDVLNGLTNEFRYQSYKTFYNCNLQMFIIN